METHKCASTTRDVGLYDLGDLDLCIKPFVASVRGETMAFQIYFHHIDNLFDHVNKTQNLLIVNIPKKKLCNNQITI